jgi:hypothetical protein
MASEVKQRQVILSQRTKHLPDTAAGSTYIGVNQGYDLIKPTDFGVIEGINLSRDRLTVPEIGLL